MDWIIPAVIGWCGTYWPIRLRFPPGGGGGGGFDPDNPWPPNCAVCGGIIGSIAAVIINILVGPIIREAGFFAMAVTAFAAGSAANGLIGGIVGMIRGK
jgi:hypothetical protein